MPDEGAVATLEAPAVDAGRESQGSIGETSTDTSTTTDQGSSDAIDNADSPSKGETGHLRGAELFKSVKEKLRNGEKLTPQEFRSIRNAVHIADKADRATGGDLEAFEKTQQIVSRLADDPEAGYTPEQIIESTLDERNFWREFDGKFEKGDPSLIEEMASANPESFQVLVPAAMDRFAQVNPEAFSAYVAKSTKGYLDGKQVPLQFAILQTFLPQMPDFPGKDRVVAAINEIYGAVQGLDEMAARPITPKKVEGTQQQSGGIDQRDERLQNKEMDLTRREWNQTTAPIGIQLRDSEIDRVASQQKVTLDDADKEKIRAAVKEEFDARCAANSKYGQAMRDYIRVGNRRAYQERAASEYKKLLPGITARHTQAFIDQKKAAATRKPAPAGTQQQQKPLQGANQRSGGSDNLVQWISGHPKTLGKQIDYSRTTNSMLLRNEAYLRGESGLKKWRAKTA